MPVYVADHFPHMAVIGSRKVDNALALDRDDAAAGSMADGLVSAVTMEADIRGLC